MVYMYLQCFFTFSYFSQFIFSHSFVPDHPKNEFVLEINLGNINKIYAYYIMTKKGGNKTLKGGSGAAEHGINVFGGIGNQHATSANDNTIAMKQMSGGKRKGGSMGVDIGAPLILTGLNQYMKRRSAKKGGKKVGGKCSLKGGKKHRMGDKSKKMMKKGKWGGKRKSMKKRGGKRMKGAGGTGNDESVYEVNVLERDDTEDNNNKNNINNDNVVALNDNNDDKLIINDEDEDQDEQKRLALAEKERLALAEKERLALEAEEERRALKAKQERFDSE